MNAYGYLTVLEKYPLVSGQGQEATQIGMAYAMKEGDISSPYYRI